MDWTALGFALTLLVTMAALVRWLFAVWFDQQKSIEDIKASHAAAAFTDLKSVVRDHEEKLSELTVKLTKLEQDITVAVLKLDDLKAAHRDSLIMIKERDIKTDKRMEALMNANRKINEELIMVRGSRGPNSK